MTERRIRPHGIRRRGIRVRRIGVAVAAAAGAGVLAAPAANAALIDIQPTPIGCAAGVAPVQSLTHTDHDGIESDEVLFVVNEQGKAGPDVNWINVSTGETGAARFEPEPGIFNAPAVLIEPEGGIVLSAIWGSYENAAGENCFLLPGIDVTQVAGETDD